MSSTVSLRRLEQAVQLRRMASKMSRWDYSDPQFRWCPTFMEPEVFGTFRVVASRAA